MTAVLAALTAAAIVLAPIALLALVVALCPERARRAADAVCEKVR